MEASQIINNKKTPINARKLAYLIEIIHALGWESFRDTDIIKPNLMGCKQYLINNKIDIKKLFGIQPHTISEEDVVDVINPLLIEYWHVQIIGDVDSASLELLYRV